MALTDPQQVAATTTTTSAPAPVLPYGLNPSVAGISTAGLTPQSATTSTSTTTGSSSSTGSIEKILPTGPYPDRELPSWLPASADALTGELAQEYANVPAAYDTSAVDAASAQQQQRDLTVGLRAAGNAASEYAARTMQQGGSAAGAGLIKAQGQIGALNAAGQAKVEAAKYDVQQREAAAGQAAQIASTLSDLRSNYLKTLTGYAAAEDELATGTKTAESATTSQTTAANTAASGVGSGGSGGGGDAGRYTIVPNAMGLASGLSPVSYQPSTGSVDRPTDNTGGVYSSWTPGT